MSNKQKNIISNFYLIREDNNPVYVGYTNRPVKQRFREHIKEKEFTGNVTVEEIDSMTFSFTWDINTINQYAQEVSDMETILIKKYGTGDSVWQKGINGRVGGQAWANVKYFVTTNKDNPKFRGVDESEILAYLDSDRVIKIYMQNFVNNIEDPVKIYMNHFVGNANEPVKDYMNHFVRTINDLVKLYMSNFVNNANEPVKLYMRDFVGHINDPIKIYMGNFVNTIGDPVKIYMKSFVNHIEDPVKIYMKNFVVNMKNKP